VLPHQAEVARRQFVRGDVETDEIDTRGAMPVPVPAHDLVDDVDSQVPHAGRRDEAPDGEIPAPQVDHRPQTPLSDEPVDRLSIGNGEFVGGSAARY